MRFFIFNAHDALNMTGIRRRDRRKMWERDREGKRDDKGEESNGATSLSVPQSKREKVEHTH